MVAYEIQLRYLVTQQQWVTILCPSSLSGIFVICREMLVRDGCHRWRLAALKPKQWLQAPAKRCGSPAEAVPGRG